MFYQRVCDEALKFNGSSREIHFFDTASNSFNGESYLSFLTKCQFLGQSFLAAGIQPQRPCIIATQTPKHTLRAFVSCLSIGSWPLIVPGAKPMRGQKLFADMVSGWVGEFGGECSVIYEEALPYEEGDCDVKVNLNRYDASLGEDLPPLEPKRSSGSEDDIAYLQLTSATTSRAKLVAVTNRNVLANVEGVRKGYGGNEDERWVTWLPLYHDMGLVGVALHCLRYSYPLFTLSPFDYLKKPVRWLEAASTYRATMIAAPNFGYDYAARMIRDTELEGIQLDSVKGAFIGAEPVLHDTLTQFCKRFSPCGFSSRALIPGYGLAESTVASTMAQVGEDLPYVKVAAGDLAPGSAVTLLEEGVLSDAQSGGGIIVFSVGKSIEGVSVRLLDSDHNEISQELTLGIISVAGTSVCKGYLKGDNLSIETFDENSLHTGDLGFLHRGNLFILERINNTIIRHGQNHFAFYFEEQVSRHLGCSPQEVIVFDADIHDPGSDVVAIVEQYQPEKMANPDWAGALAELELPIDKVLFSGKRVIPRTTSGKKKYLQCRQMYQEGKLSVQLLTT